MLCEVESNRFSDYLPLYRTRAATPLWGVTSSVAAIVYSIRVASRSSRQAQAFSCLTRAKHALAYIVNFEVATTSPFILREETSSAYASRLQVYSKIQDCMNVFAKYARIFRIQMSFNFSQNRTVFSVRPSVTEKYCTRSWDNKLSDCLPLMTSAARHSDRS